MTTVARHLARCLYDLGVRHAFGIPGGATLPLLEGFAQVGIEFVLTRHETAAGFMADAAYQLTGRPGVCVSTLGPGATQLLAGVTAAWLERSRVLAIVGQCSPGIEAVYTHQILDQIALFRPVTARAEALRSATAGQQIALALRRLTAGPPRPVLLELAADVARSSRERPPPPPPPTRTPQPRTAQPRTPLPVTALPVTALAPVVRARVRSARRPIIFVGCGDLSTVTAAAVSALAIHLRAPVITTYRAKGMIGAGEPWSAGAAGLSPRVDQLQQSLLARADLLLAVGLDPVELRSNWLPGWPASLATLSIDPHGQPDLLCPLVADLRGAVAPTLGLLTRRGASEWTEAEVANHRGELETLFRDGPDGPASTLAAIQRAARPETTFTVDVGAHRITASHVLRCMRPRQLLQSNGLSSMGTALPMAIAAKLVDPTRPVIAVTGDMGLWMVQGELGTAAERALDLVVVYLADRTLSLIALKQTRSGEEAGGGVTFDNPDPVALAAAFGGTGRRVRGAEAVQAAVRDAQEAGGLWLIEAQIDPDSYRGQM